MSSAERIFIDCLKVYGCYADRVKCLELINLITELLLAFTWSARWMNGWTTICCTREFVQLNFLSEFFFNFFFKFKSCFVKHVVAISSLTRVLWTG